MAVTVEELTAQATPSLIRAWLSEHHVLELLPQRATRCAASSAAVPPTPAAEECSDASSDEFAWFEDLPGGEAAAPPSSAQPAPAPRASTGTSDPAFSQRDAGQAALRGVLECNAARELVVAALVLGHDRERAMALVAASALSCVLGDSAALLGACSVLAALERLHMLAVTGMPAACCSVLRGVIAPFAEEASTQVVADALAGCQAPCETTCDSPAAEFARARGAGGPWAVHTCVIASSLGWDDAAAIRAARAARADVVLMCGGAPAGACTALAHADVALLADLQPSDVTRVRFQQLLLLSHAR